MPFTLDIEGIDTIKDRLAKASDEVLKEVDNEMNASILTMKQGAQQDAPRDQATLANEITADTSIFLRKSLVSAASYSAYVEFGTRDYVSIPPGLEAEAAAAQNATGASSLSAKEAIFNWCRRHGIEQKLWYPIFITIMVKGIHPHPFFFKQLDAEKANLLNRLQQIL